MTAPPVFLVDCDGVLTHTFVDYAVWYARSHGVPEASVKSITDFNIFKAWGAPQLWKPFTEFINHKGAVSSMVPEPGARDNVERLRRLGIVLACTSPMAGCEHWYNEREAWLQEHFGFDRKDIFQVHQKGRILADVLIDDAEHSCADFDKAGGLAIVIDQPWNRHAILHGGRAANLAQAVTILEELYGSNTSQLSLL